MSDSPIPISRLAEITARLDAGEPRSAILNELGVLPEELLEAQERWLAAIGHQVLQGDFKLQRQYSSEYLVQLELARRRLSGRTNTPPVQNEMEPPRAPAAKAPAFEPPLAAPIVQPSFALQGPPAVQPAPVAHPPAFIQPPPVFQPAPVAQPPAVVPPPPVVQPPVVARPQAFVQPAPVVPAPVAQPHWPAESRSGPMGTQFAPTQSDMTITPDSQDEPTVQGMPTPKKSPGGSFANTGFMMSPFGAQSEADAPAPPAHVEGNGVPLRPRGASIKALPEDLSGFNSFSPLRAGPAAAQPAPAPPPGPYAAPPYLRAPPGPGGTPAYAAPIAPPSPGAGAPGMSPPGMVVPGAPLGASPPLGGVAAQGPIASVAVQLSLEQIACIVAELDIDAARAPQVLRSNGIDGATFERQRAQLELDMAADEAALRRFEQLRQYYRAILGSR